MAERLLLAFTPRDFYWQLAGHTKVYSSDRNIEVLTTDQPYQDWLAKGYSPTPIDTEAQLWTVLQSSCPDKFPSWLFNGTVFIQPAINNYTPAQIRSYSAMIRYNTETGGINFTPPSGPSQGIKLLIDTSRDSVAQINNSVMAAQQDSSFTAEWKCRDGVFHTVDATTMIKIGGNVTRHLQICFSTEQQCLSYTTTTAVDDAFSAISIEYTS